MGDTSGQGNIAAKLAHSDLSTLAAAEYGAHLVNVAGRFGVRVEALLKGTGLSLASLDTPGARIPRDGFFALAERALALTQEPGLGFYYGLSLKLSAHGAPGLLAMTSGTLRDSITIVERFIRLRAHDMRVSTYVEGDSFALEFEDDVPPQLKVFFTEAFIMMLLQVGRALVGHPLSGVCEMSFPEPAHFRRFAHLLPATVRFSQRANRVLLPMYLLDEAVLTSDVVMARRVERECQRELAELDERASFLTKVRRMLRPEAGLFPSLEEIAEQTNTSTRTLKRKLAEQGTTYRKLVDELRRDRALDLLRTSSYSVEKIASLLGYTDAASFHRSFRRWFGSTPGAYRE